MRALGIVALISTCGVATMFSLPAAGQTQAAQTYPVDTPSYSQAPLVLTIPGPNPDGWLFPLTEADGHLPSRIEFGGQFRDRWEMAGHIGYRSLSDGYHLTQLRLGVYIRPVKWFELLGVTQDARAFFNQYVPNTSLSASRHRPSRLLLKSSTNCERQIGS
jgi:hypothetical protein